MATTTTVRSPTPNVPVTPRSAHRRVVASKSSAGSRLPPSSRGVGRARSDESLDHMQIFMGSRGSGGDIPTAMNASTSMSNRQRVAKAAAATMAQFNDSTGSLKSENSRDSRVNRGSGERSSRPRRTSKDRLVRRQRSISPELEEDASVAGKSTASRSHRDRESRRSGRSGHRSKSRSKSRGPRSKSATARSTRIRRPTTRGPKEETEPTDFNNSTCFIPPISPAQSKEIMSPRNASPLDDEGLLMSPPLSGKSEASKLSISEMELLDFLDGGGGATTSQRLTRSVPFLPADDTNNSGHALRTATKLRGGSGRRERTSGASGSKSRSNDRPTALREGFATTGITSSSQYKRPPRNARGVGRSQSASAQPAVDADAVLSRRINPTTTSASTSTTGSRSSNREEPSRGVRRAKSTDDMGDLNTFFNHNGAVSRRKKPGSSSKSVASMPSRTKRSGNRRRTETDSADSIKPPSSRSTVTSTETPYDSEEDDGDDSIDESLEDLNDSRQRQGLSNRSVESSPSDLGHDSYGSLGSLTNLSMEAALQMHMSRTENLLFDVFPKHIAEALRSGRKVEPENHDCVTIFFSDIVGFTEISSVLDPMKISDLLDRLYNSFDALSHYHDVFKVETIGDAYMAVTNLTKKQPDHCKRIAEFAIDAIRVANQTLVDKEDPTRGFVNIRVGFHSGPVVSNVVGSRNPRFCLFGDTVNTASRMESNSAPNRIHCSGASAELLKIQHPNLRLNPRGTIEVKGKGDMETFWVNEDAAVQSQRNGTSRSIFKILNVNKRQNRRGSVV